MSGEKLTLVPASGTPAPEASTAVLVRLGLTYAGSRRPLELALCSDHQCEKSFFVKAGARSARCEHCDARHRVVSLAEAVGAGAVCLGGCDGAIVCINAEDLFEPMFRELQSRAGATGAGGAQ